jgi:hypothetical protein
VPVGFATAVGVGVVTPGGGTLWLGCGTAGLTGVWLGSGRSLVDPLALGEGGWPPGSPEPLVPPGSGAEADTEAEADTDTDGVAGAVGVGVVPRVRALRWRGVTGSFMIARCCSPLGSPAVGGATGGAAGVWGPTVEIGGATFVAGCLLAIESMITLGPGGPRRLGACACHAWPAEAAPMTMATRVGTKVDANKGASSAGCPPWRGVTSWGVPGDRSPGASRDTQSSPSSNRHVQAAAGLFGQRVAHRLEPVGEPWK